MLLLHSPSDGPDSHARLLVSLSAVTLRRLFASLCVQDCRRSVSVCCILRDDSLGEVFEGSNPPPATTCFGMVRL
jgi:hypothetical protein